MRENISPAIINIHQTKRELEEKEFIDSENNLLPKAMSLIAKVESFFKIHKKKTSTQLLGKDFTDNMTTYNEMFPSKKAGSGKYMRANIKNVETNFRWFFENYNYSWEIILDATAKYLNQQLLDNFKYTRTSMYFIRKQDKGIINSDLADWCEIVSTGEDEDDVKRFSDKVV